MRGHVEKEMAGNHKNVWRKSWQNDAAEKPKKPCISVCAPTRSAASRDGMAGWAGEGGGRFGERREYEAPTLPRTPRQHGAARTPHTAAAAQPPRQPASQPAEKRQPQNTCPINVRTATLVKVVNTMTSGGFRPGARPPSVRPTSSPAPSRSGPSSRRSARVSWSAAGR